MLLFYFTFLLKILKWFSVKLDLKAYVIFMAYKTFKTCPRPALQTQHLPCFPSWLLSSTKCITFQLLSKVKLSPALGTLCTLFTFLIILITRLHIHTGSFSSGRSYLYPLFIKSFWLTFPKYSICLSTEICYFLYSSQILHY